MADYLSRHSFWKALDKQFDEVFETLSPRISNRKTGWVLDESQHMNIARHPIHFTNNKDGSFKIEFDVPGCGKENLEISYDERTALLTVKSKIEEKKEKDYLSSSHSYMVTINDVDLNSFVAECDKGILTITGKRNTNTGTRKIEISSK